MVCVCLAGARAEQVGDGDIIRAHAIALHGEPKYGPAFEHFDYVNPAAPKGGSVRLAQIGTFDNLNPFILKGSSAAGLLNLFDSLTYHADDEAFSEYGLIAKEIRIPEDRSWVEFELRPEARFHDGSPITVEDVVFTLEALKQEGHPFYRAYYANVVEAKRAGERTVRFLFNTENNRELPLIVGQMPILSKAYWSGKNFEETTLEPPLGSGPYRVDSVNPGRSITYRRVEDYWGAHLPVNTGRNNFDSIRHDYYRDATVALEAFKAGEYDFRVENIAKSWATGYDGPALEEGFIVKEEIPHELPTGMQGFVFNTRREIFRDRRVRWAIAHAFDFEWTNQNLFYGAYTRTTSYFSNSQLAARGLPSPEELEVLEPFRGRVPGEVFTQPYEPPSTDGSGNIRRNLRKALTLLKQAGWGVQDGQLVHAATGRPMRFEMMLISPAFERVVLPFQRNLERLGIDMRVRTVDPAQYENRVESFDFDMIVFSRGQSLSPGNEQREFWTTEAADIPGSGNLAGIRDPAVDELVELVVSAPDRGSLIQRTRALDRVLLWGHYVIPHWHIRAFRVAHWNKFDRPTVSPKYALGFDTWWVDQAKATRLEQRKSGLFQ
ncbi:MAG: ABC transporter substrate-binding protein [Gammaproteobacteria bacterium]|nr:ABC transporter substrate-binding protein [Gammaproteobacteria bacterium]NIR83069.1 ABC transporter substrate-binding protein [Gammaproteobacteria bacterium]NIR90731.1 ABC transporter substrate-binding protein [Gammaproteobacteria bacterium]NIU04222.1 ABC transporter substrate-binding protein [Gammaproteobacteria bacterium]NIV51514.1 ABC transporter substrate-binding protein [Gammaproteobacteria bacterium]